MRSDVASPIDVSDATKRLAENACFIRELRFVRNVLIIAPAADSKMRARRRDAFGCGANHAVEARPDEFLLGFDRLRDNRFAGKYVRQKDRGAFVMCEAIAAINELFDF